jgi:hypothetical protein
MSTKFSVKINNEDIIVASRYGINGKLHYTIKNPLVLLLPGHIQLDNDNFDNKIKTVKDLNLELSKQNLDNQ